MHLTDTHCHLDFNKFDLDRDEVIQRAMNAGLNRILIPGITLPSSRAVVEMAESRPILYAAIGVHPTEALTWKDDSRSALHELAGSTKVVAVGEIGLDYYWDSAPHDLQKHVLRNQLELASELELPAVIHLREKENVEEGECFGDALEILTSWVRCLQESQSPLAKKPGVLHSFSGSRSYAEKAIDLGFYIGVTGPVTYKNAHSRHETLAALPLERLLIETDAPFLTPVPHRGTRNEPAFVEYVAEKIASLHSTTPSNVADITSANAAGLFAWGG